MMATTIHGRLQASRTPDRFGRPGGVDVAWLKTMPPVIQAEGFRMLAEMGEAPLAIAERTGLPENAVRSLAGGNHPPFQRGGDVNVVAEGI